MSPTSLYYKYVLDCPASESIFCTKPELTHSQQHMSYSRTHSRWTEGKTWGKCWYSKSRGFSGPWSVKGTPQSEQVYSSPMVRNASCRYPDSKLKRNHHCLTPNPSEDGNQKVTPEYKPAVMTKSPQGPNHEVWAQPGRPGPSVTSHCLLSVTRRGVSRLIFWLGN